MVLPLIARFVGKKAATHIMKRKPLRSFAKKSKRRRVDRRRKRKGVKDIKTLKEILHDTHNKTTILSPVTTKRTLLGVVPFDNIGEGDNRWNRSGDKITVTGIRYDYSFQITDNANVGHCVLHMLLFKQYRDLDMSQRLYLSTTDDDAPIGFTADGVTAGGDAIRDRRKFNTREMKILSYKKVTCGSPSCGQSDRYQRYVTGTSFYKCHMPVRYTLGAGSLPPYPIQNIWPRVVLYYWISQPDTVINDTTTAASAAINQTVYFKG